MSALFPKLAWPAARGFSLFIGLFAGLSLAEEVRAGAWLGNLWWIDLRFLPVVPAQVLVGLLALALGAFGLHPRPGPWRHRATFALVALFLGVALVNSLQFFALLLAGRVQAGIPLPFSLLVAGGLAGVLGMLRREPPPAGAGMLAPSFAVCTLLGLAFPILQMGFFGKTDYARPAGAAVVFGARAYADGRLSTALEDRVNTACHLYRQGIVDRLIFSGGPGDGAVHETEAMARFALRHGVARGDILVDEGGLNTAATVRNTVPVLQEMSAARGLAVSHFYHLPRIKLAYQRAGLEIRTVPARESHLLRQLPFNMAREVAAFWVYYFRGVV